QIKKIRERLEKGRKEPKKEDVKKDEPKKDETKKDEPPKDSDKPKSDKPDEAPIKLDPLIAKRAADATDELRNTFKTWNGFYDGYLPEYSWWMKKPVEDTQK